MTAPPDSTVRTLLRWLLGGALVAAGTGHLTVQRDEFQAQVPDWFPLDDDLVVLGSGVVEIALGAALIGLPRHRVVVGMVVAAFFVVIFPGNIAQWREGTDAFGLDTDAKRFGRLFFQPVLVIWALFSTGAWHAWRTARAARPSDRIAR
ncbi:MAG: MauE/DoxX family redox-associated membrane protein [Ilumatobacter sp.]|uniref:DoxX family protein n=1 Tax=Ilumatobacter sp. TaxID=1967498 RepID=UPI00391D1E6F